MGRIRGLSRSRRPAWLTLTAAGFALQRRAHVPTLARRTLWGGVLTVGLLVAFGLAATVGFDALFLLFHRVSFANDFWQLDPRTDYLVLLFPQNFWFDATMWAALRALAGGVRCWRRRAVGIWSGGGGEGVNRSDLVAIPEEHKRRENPANRRAPHLAVPKRGDWWANSWPNARSRSLRRSSRHRRGAAGGRG